jgi:hypothetical protein
MTPIRRAIAQMPTPDTTRALTLLVALAITAFATPALAYDALFVGNSYTFYGSPDLPTAFGELLEAQGGFGPVRSEGAVKAAWRLDQHLADSKVAGNPIHTLLGDGAEAAGNTSWDIVVLQEQSQIPGFPPGQPQYEASQQAAQELNTLIASRGAMTVFLMTWGRRDGDSQNPQLFGTYQAHQDKLADGYRAMRAATATAERPTFIAPVGLVFSAVRELITEGGGEPDADGSLFRRLYTADGSHPSQLGTWVIAWTVFATVTGLDPAALGVPSNQDAADLALIEAAVHRVVLDGPYSKDPVGSAGPLWAFPWLQDGSTLTAGTLDGTQTRPVAVVTEDVDVPGSLSVGTNGRAGLAVQGGRLTVGGGFDIGPGGSWSYNLGGNITQGSPRAIDVVGEVNLAQPPHIDGVHPLVKAAPGTAIALVQGASVAGPQIWSDALKDQLVAQDPGASVVSVEIAEQSDGRESLLLSTPGPVGGEDAGSTAEDMPHGGDDSAASGDSAASADSLANDDSAVVGEDAGLGGATGGGKDSGCSVRAGGAGGRAAGGGADGAAGLVVVLALVLLGVRHAHLRA